MKRKLALLMAFMMTAAMVPASHVDAASRNAVSKSITAVNSARVDETSGVVLSFSNDTAVASIEGAEANDEFELHLDGEARWTYDSSDLRSEYVYKDETLYPNANYNEATKMFNFANGGGVGTAANLDVTRLWNGDPAPTTAPKIKIKGLENATVQRVTDTILRVKVNAGYTPTTTSGGVTTPNPVKIPLLVFFNGQPNGPQVVRVVPKNSSVSAGEYTFANVESDAIKFRVQKKEKISRSGNTKVQLIFDEINPSAFNGKEIQLKLPKGFAWDVSTSGTNEMEKIGLSVSKMSGGKDLYKESDGRIIVVTPTPGTNLQSAYLNIAIVPDRSARYGDVDVIVQNNSDVAPSSLVVAEYVDYGVSVKAEKVLNVIAGKDMEGLYRSKLILEEPATSSLQGNRYMEFTFVDEKGKEVKASLQDQEILKLTKKAGDSKTKLYIDPKSINDYGDKDGKVSSYTVDTNKADKSKKAANKFDLYVEEQSEKVRAKYELEVPFVVASNFEGKLFVKVKGAGAEEQLVQIADVKPSVTFEVQGALPQVKIGLQKQKGQDILIKETEAAALQDYEPAGSANYAKYELYPEENFNLKFDDADVKVKEGDIMLNSADPFGNENQEIYVKVDRRSTKPSTLLVSDVLVTLDRTVPYGAIRLEGHYGVVNGRHALTNRTKTFDYFTTITPVSDDKRITTVFSIDSKDYAEVVGGVREDKNMDVAPFIQDNRTMLPVRYIANAIGAEVNYDSKTRIATFQKYQSVVTLNIDKNVMYVNGSPVQLYTKPANVEGRIFLPLVNVAQAFGLKQGQNIIWNQDKKTVTILPQDATPEEVKAAEDGSVLDNAKYITAAPAAPGTEEDKEKADETKKN